MKATRFPVAEQPKEPMLPRYLFPVSPREYGHTFRADLLTQYKLYLDSVRTTSQERHNKDNFFLTIHSLFLSAYGIAYTNTNLFADSDFTVFVSAIGVVMCIHWWAVSVSYRKRNRVKMQLVHHIETYLPVSVYRAERELMRRQYRWISRRSDWLRYATPWIFVFMYTAIPFIV